MIETLTPEQEALIPMIRDEWIKIGLDATETDKQKAEAAINLAYECAGFKPPLRIVWFNNPVEAIVSRLYPKDKVGANVSYALFDAVKNKINEAVSEAVQKTVTDLVSNAVDEAIWESIWKQITNSVKNDVIEAFVAAGSDSIVAGLDDGGVHDYLDEFIGRPPGTARFAFYAYFQAIGVECSELKGLLAIAKHCGWWWEFREEVAFVTPKPSAIRRDAEGRLHAEGEPAVAYEGCNLYFYHGVRLPAKYGQLLPKDWQVKWLVLEKSEKVREVLIKGMNLDRSEVPRLTKEATEEFIASFLPYREKWRAIALSTEQIDRQKASEAIKAAYSIIPIHLPQIHFFDSPYAACQAIMSNQKSELGNSLRWRLDGTLKERPESQLKQQLRSEFWREMKRQLHGELRNELGRRLEPWHQLERHLQSQVDSRILDNKCIITEDWTYFAGSLFDFCINVLNCTSMPERWLVFQSIVNNCGWIFPFENVCFVCDRPIKISLDDRQRLHAEGEPAIEFADGYCLYSYHGVTLPEKYGKLHPERWQAERLLEEENAELRRVLIQGIGYARICQELEAVELDNWQEYTLLRINSDVDIERIYLLKMTCPSTGLIHALRVPPDVKTAREAIKWVNWGIDPEDFAIQT